MSDKECTQCGVEHSKHDQSAFCWLHPSHWPDDKFHPPAVPACPHTDEEIGMTAPVPASDKVNMLAEAVFHLLVKAGVVRENAVPTIPELLMVAEQYCKQGSPVPSSGGCGKPGHIPSTPDPGEGEAATLYCVTCEQEATIGNAHESLTNLLRTVAPTIHPLPTLSGLCTQVDNYIARLKEERDKYKQIRDTVVHLTAIALSASEDYVAENPIKAIREVKERAESAVNALRKYGQHRPGCEGDNAWMCSQPTCGEIHYGKCTCGLESALPPAATGTEQTE